ncbi:MAG: hypothetical protein ACRDKW_09025, partial [Actinomycetota bacterium]
MVEASFRWGKNPSFRASIKPGAPQVHSVGGTVVLLVILVLNVYKPRGMTRYGWRKQHEQRKHRAEW